jgi:hypothetical protein
MPRRADWRLVLIPAFLFAGLFWISSPYRAAWFTIAGAVALYILLTPPSPRESAEPRGSRSGLLAALGVLVLAIFGLRWADAWAVRMGMPPVVFSPEFLAYSVAFVILQTAVHEFGHAVVAWAFGFRIRVLSIGPFVFWKDW